MTAEDEQVQFPAHAQSARSEIAPAGAQDADQPARAFRLQMNNFSYASRKLTLPMRKLMRRVWPAGSTGCRLLTGTISSKVLDDCLIIELTQARTL